MQSKYTKIFKTVSLALTLIKILCIMYICMYVNLQESDR